MALFKAYDPNVEVSGEAVISIIDGMGIFKKKAEDILAQNQIINPTPGEWYSQQQWLDAFEEIHNTLGLAVLFGIGSTVLDNAIFPPDINTIEEALQSIDVAYHMNHRGGEIGNYNYQKGTQHNTAQMICNNPYPCNFDQGIVTQAMKRYRPESSLGVLLMHDETAPCRSKGETHCIYDLEW